jgi:hypothetical protein
MPQIGLQRDADFEQAEIINLNFSRVCVSNYLKTNRSSHNKTDSSTFEVGVSERLHISRPIE